MAESPAIPDSFNAITAHLGDVNALGDVIAGADLLAPQPPEHDATAAARLACIAVLHSGNGEEVDASDATGAADSVGYELLGDPMYEGKAFDPSDLN